MTTEQIYIAIDELIALLKRGKHAKFAMTLEHRMYKVSWTSGSELLENVAYLLTAYSDEHGDNLDRETIEKIESIITAIRLILGNGV